jgi:hypothetical protein
MNSSDKEQSGFITLKAPMSIKSFSALRRFESVISYCDI